MGCNGFVGHVLNLLRLKTFNVMIKKIFEKKRSIVNIVFKHLLVSASCATLDLVVFGCAFHYLGVGVSWAYIMGFSMATTLGFFGHSFFTFDVGRVHFKNALLFIFQASLSFLLGYCLLLMLINAGLQVMFAKATQLGLTFFFNVGVGKFVTFKKREK